MTFEKFHRVAVAASALALLLDGCTTPMAGFTRNLCVAGAVPVSSRWDDQLHRVFDRLARIAGADVAWDDVVIVAVDGPPTLSTAWTCGGMRRSTIAFTVRALARLNTFRAADELVAVTIAHELAHVALHIRSSGKNTDVEEIEADTLGVYYFERAGYDCRRWVTGEGYVVPEDRREAADVACADAKRGLRPSLRRSSP